jgi:two-component system sensor histidine kinase MtrB
MASLRVGLRARTTMAFALSALGVSVALAAITYGLTRTYLVRQRESLAVRQTYLDARVVRDVLQASTTDLGELVDGLAGQAGSGILVNREDRWFSSSLSIGESVLPEGLRTAVQSGSVGRQRIEFDSVPTLVVGVPLPAADAYYYEVFPMRELDRTLTTLSIVLLIAASITTMGGALVGLAVSRRVLRPLREVSAASAEIAGGALSTRLENAHDPDLELLVTSFNDMATSLERRIEREARFASDVSHELRTPLTAMTNAVQIVRARAHDLPPRTQTALTIFGSQVEYFEQLVLDLLEISRLDAGVERLDLGPTDLEALLRRAVARTGSPCEVVVADDVPAEVMLDERRIGQVLTNLLDNAQRYGGGATAMSVAANAGRLSIFVDDAGPGVAESDRGRIFERFHRGTPLVGDTSRKGTGLGLALAREHIALHGGTLIVAAAPTGGARFVIDLPCETS